MACDITEVVFLSLHAVSENTYTYLQKYLSHL